MPGTMCTYGISTHPYPSIGTFTSIAGGSGVVLWLVSFWYSIFHSRRPITLSTAERLDPCLNSTVCEYPHTFSDPLGSLGFVQSVCHL